MSYTNLGEFDNAIPLLKDTLKISSEIGAKDIFARANMTLGQIYMMNLESEKANMHFQEVITIFRELNIPEYQQAKKYLHIIG